jgi:hypothetical protein
MAPKSKAQTPFQATHALEFGLEVIKTEQKGDQTVRCLFCVYEGRNQVQVGLQTGRKRQSRSDIKYYVKPFAPQNYRSHLTSQHAESWAAYNALSQAGRRVYFTSKTKRVNTMHHHMDLEADTLVFKVNSPIVDTIIADLFFRDDEMLDDVEEDGEDEVEAGGAAMVIAKNAEKKAKQRANTLKLFVKDNSTGKYVVTIKNVTRYELAMDHVSCGMSFRQTAQAIEHAKRRTSTAKLAGVTDFMVGTFVRALVASNLQRVSDFLDDSSVWAFSFAADGSTHRGQSFFDMRIRFCHQGNLVNIHLVAIPMFDRHSALNIFTLIRKFLDALYPSWRSKLISVSSDGENTMTGRHSGLVTRLCQAAEHEVLRIWCLAHQLDLVTKRAAEIINDGDWVKFVYKFSVFLRAQNNLIIEMNVQCPKKTTRWVVLGKILQFFILYRRRIIQYTEVERPENLPTDSWWIVTYAISPAIDKVNETFVLLQNRALLIAQQEAYNQSLLATIIQMFDIQTNEGGADNGEEDGYMIVGSFRIARASLLLHIEDQGSAASEYLERINEDEKNAVLMEIARYVIEMISGIDAVKAERDNNNLPHVQDAPPVLPGQLVKLRHSAFIRDVLKPYREQINKFWSVESVDEIEADHRLLLKLYAEDERLCLAIDRQDVTTLFNDAWDVLKGRVNSLRSFCGGLASAFANTTSVESDFSILKWEMDANRTCLMHLSLEGIFQTKQRKLLQDLSKSYD